MKAQVLIGVLFFSNFRNVYSLFGIFDFKINNSCKNYSDYYNILLSRNCFYIPDLGKDVTEIVERHIGVVETHTVTTEDGYILNLFRLPRKNPKDVIMFQHPFAIDSKIWVSQYKESTAFVFWKAGYDVWLSNNRGTLYSQEHVNLTRKDEKFWDFSWHEMGVHDIHATVTYIKKVTGRQKIVFLGHSMGTMAGLVYASLRPKEASESIKVMVDLCTTAFLKYGKSPLFDLAVFNSALQNFNKLTHWYSLLDYNAPYMILFRKALIALPNKKWFIYLLDTLLGWSPENHDPQYFNLMISTFGSEFSWKIVYHDFQIINNDGAFQMYDYGKVENLKRYGQEEPPLYPLENIEVPIYLIYGSKDIIGQPEDNELLYSKLPERSKIYGRLVIEGFNHIDFHYGKGRIEKVHNRIIKLLNNL